MKKATQIARVTPKEKLIQQALDILNQCGIPISSRTKAQNIRMAQCIIVLSGVKRRWVEARSPKAESFHSTRAIIKLINDQFGEQISSGSYDDIRRKHLKLPVMANLVINSGKLSKSATNNPTRGYDLLPEFRALIATYETPSWKRSLNKFLEAHSKISELLERKRALDMGIVNLPDGTRLEFSPGEHNLLQKEIIEQFLPRFAGGCDILYVGDTTKRLLFINEKALLNLNFFELNHDLLPDIVAHLPSKNWIFLIEAVHSSGPISESRMFELKSLLSGCTSMPVYVTCFNSRKDFRKWSSEIAWESEVWIAENPDHMIHFNGDKFLGPHK